MTTALRTFALVYTVETTTHAQTTDAILQRAVLIFQIPTLAKMEICAHMAMDALTGFVSRAQQEIVTTG
jgi:hypothetical protein